MTHEQMIPGTKILYHGGWDGKKVEKCPDCGFSCGYILPGEIVERYHVWDTRSEQFLPHPHLWTAKLETGAYASGYVEQFQKIAEPSA